MYAAWVYIFAQLSDLVTTLWAIAAGLQEVNPVILWLAGIFGFGAAITLAKSFLIALALPLLLSKKLEARTPRIVKTCIYFAAGLTFLVAANNLRGILSHG